MPRNFTGSVLEGFGPLKKMLKPCAVLSIFSYKLPSKQRKTSEARNALVMHHDIISELLSAGPSYICDQQNEAESLTKDVLFVHIARTVTVMF